MTDIPKMSKNDARDTGIGAIILTLIVLGVLLGGLVLFSAFWTELKWFEQLSAARVFWTQYGAWIIFSAIGAVIAAIVMMISIRIALGADTKRGEKGKKNKANTQPTIKLDRDGKPVSESSDAVLTTLRKQRWIALWVFPIITGVLFGGQLGNSWQTFLVWLNSTPFNQTDPEFGHDVSFYIFTLPAIHRLMSFLLMLVFLAVAATAVGYWINGKLEFKKGVGFSFKSRLHLGILAALFALLVAGNFWLARYDLLLNNGTGSTNRFSGASFTDINASLPGMTILAVSVAAIAVLILISAIRNSFKPALVGVAATLVAGIVLTSVYPMLVQNFKVNPNAA
ncbi:MAG: UPF0182 family protein, partial [Arcanobacterium sp.]|nr:UPF0182 family protein [Arcanobacterium sp.]